MCAKERSNHNRLFNLSVFYTIHIYKSKVFHSANSYKHSVWDVYFWPVDANDLNPVVPRVYRCYQTSLSWQICRLNWAEQIEEYLCRTFHWYFGYCNGDKPYSGCPYCRFNRLLLQFTSSGNCFGLLHFAVFQSVWKSENVLLQQAGATKIRVRHGVRSIIRRRHQITRQAKKPN
jgi:hypothetical protein